MRLTLFLKGNKMNIKLRICSVITFLLASFCYGSIEQPVTREEFERKVKQQQVKIEELEKTVSEQKKQILDLEWQIYHLKHKPEPNEEHQSDKRTETKKLQSVIEGQEVEIARLKKLFRNARIDPDSETSSTNKLMTKAEKVVMPKYIILNEDIYDVPAKTQVVLEVLVSGKISEPGLIALLEKLYTSTKAKRGFKYHNSPTNIYIYAFTSRERFESEMGQWIGMVDWVKDYDTKPNISISKRQIAHLGDKPEERFGLSEAQRIQIWKEYVKTEDRSTEEAEKKYPLSGPSLLVLSDSEGIKRIKKNAELMHRLEEYYKNELAKKYRLTHKQLEEISMEGITKDWPFPK